MVLCYSPSDVMEQNAAATPEEQERGMGTWMKWA